MTEVATTPNAMDDGPDASSYPALPASIGAPMLPFGMPVIPSMSDFIAVPQLPALPLGAANTNPQAVTKDVPAGGGRKPYMPADPDAADAEA